MVACYSTVLTIFRHSELNGKVRYKIRRRISVSSESWAPISRVGLRLSPQGASVVLVGSYDQGYCPSLRKEEHLRNLWVTLASRRSDSSGRKCAMSSLTLFQKITIPSRYTRADSYFRKDNMESIACWNFTGALSRSTCICTNWKSP